MPHYCRDSYDRNFAVVANVVHMAENRESFRIGYGVPFGQQDGEFLADFGLGAHGFDAQYLVVDVVNGQLTAAWADLHKGSYALSRESLKVNSETHVGADPS